MAASGATLAAGAAGGLAPLASRPALLALPGDADGAIGLAETAEAPALSEEPDAALIRLSRQWMDLEFRKAALYRAGATSIAEEERMEACAAPLWDEQAKLIQQICAIHASTMTGITARARGLAVCFPHLLGNQRRMAAAQDEALIAATVRDLIALPEDEKAGLAPPRPQPQPLPQQATVSASAPDERS